MRSRLSVRIIVTAKNLNVKENQFSVVRKAFGQVIWTDDVLLRKPKNTLCFSTFLCCVAGRFSPSQFLKSAVENRAYRA